MAHERSTVRSPVILIVHEPSGCFVQPLHVSVFGTQMPAISVYVSETVEPGAKVALQVVPHAMPAGVEVTVNDEMRVIVRVTGAASGAADDEPHAASAPTTKHHLMTRP